jgi:hypothetical protein
MVTVGTGGSDSGGTTGAGGSPATGGTTSKGGTIGTGGAATTGGTTSTGGITTAGGTTTTGGTTEKGGTTGTGGAPASGGVTGSAGITGRDAGPGDAKAGNTGTGGVTGPGGITGRDGGPGSGGVPGSTDGGASTVNCSAAMPSGGTVHSGSTQGGSGSLAWSLWMNGNGGSITTFSTPAFSASWGPSSGDYLARMGLEWGNGGKTYDAYGTITAQFAYTKTGNGGGYSYIGIYGWSTNPCVEYYIVDDSFNTMPFNAYNSTLKGTATIDGETYKLFSNNTNGTGGSRCSGVSSWLQFWSIRQKARQCGQISITQHFNAWKAAGMTLGNMLEAKILVEVGGGTGTVSFPVANVTATP